MSVPDPQPVETAVLIGGPKDGREITASYVGQPIIHVPVIRTGAAHQMPVTDQVPTLDEIFPVDVYDLQHDPTGFPSRDDRGRLRYQLRAR